jgi:predicted transcriptional regulator
MTIHDFGEASGEELLRVLSALASPQRFRLVVALARERSYVSQLAREVGLSRPLAHMHLQRLEEAGLVSSHLELSEDGKAVRYFELVPFVLCVTPDRIASALQSLERKDGEAPRGEENA